jgi:hypothetical protein
VYRHENWQYVRDAHRPLRYPLYWDGSHDQEWWHNERGSAGTHAWTVEQGQTLIGGCEYVVQATAGNAGGTSAIDAYTYQSSGARYYRAYWTWAWGGAASNLVDADLDELTFALYWDRPDGGRQVYVVADSAAGVTTSWHCWVSPGVWLDLPSLPWPTAAAAGIGVYSLDVIVDIETGTYRSIAVGGIEATEIAGTYPQIGTGASVTPGTIVEAITLDVANTGDLNTMWLGPHAIEALDL